MSRFRGGFDKQYGKCAQALLKSATNHLYHIYWSLPSQLTWKKSLLLTCQILGLLVNTLAADKKYRVLNRENLTIPIQMQLSHKQKTFSQFFATFLKSRLNLKHFQKRDDPHSFCSSEVTYSKNVARKKSKNYSFGRPFDKQHGKRAQALFKSASLHLYHICWSLPRKFSRKKSVLLTCKILGLLVNTLAADKRYLVVHRDNLTTLIRIHLSKKLKVFCQFFTPFWKSRLNFKHFE